MILTIIILTILQNASFTLVSRARNSDSILFHGFASVLSNGAWLLLIREVVMNLDSKEFMIAYLFGSVFGSVLMHHLSMKYIEPYFKKRKDGKHK